LWCIFTIVYVLAFLMPGDPLKSVLGEDYRRLSPTVIESAKERLGLNQPFLVRYLRFLGALLRGDLGRSYILEQDVSEIIAYRLPHTLKLMAGGMFVALVIGVPAGIFMANYDTKWFARMLMGAILLSASVPVFWLALLAQLFLTQRKYGLALFPVAGYEDGSLIHLVLPSLVLGTHLATEIAFVTRVAMLEVRDQEYMITARAKGLQRRTILLRHHFWNASIPIITIIGLDIGYLFGGSVVTETVFNWPGLGRAIVPAIERRDTPVILGILTFGAFLFIVVNLVTDILFTLVNPRIRYTVRP
jgi:peptide/nickel transport system permease protein